MHEMRHDISEKHSGEKTTDVVIPVHCDFSFLVWAVGIIRKLIFDVGDAPMEHYSVSLSVYSSKEGLRGAP